MNDLHLISCHTAPQHGEKCVKFTEGLEICKIYQGNPMKNEEKPGKIQEIQGLNFLYSIFYTFSYYTSSP